MLKRHISDSVKRLMTMCGARFPARAVHGFVASANYVRLGRWMADHGFVFVRRETSRTGVFDRMLERAADRRVLYLEFGVWEGASMKYWSRRLRHPGSRLHGFDSFEGLPQTGGFWEKGQFDLEGVMPTVDDPRVTFFKGWFEDVLPHYEPPEHDLLVINLDADLYSSTIHVLRHLRPIMKPGTIVYFDDMPAVEHEPRAIHEFLLETRQVWKPLAADRSLEHAAFEIVDAGLPVDNVAN